MSLRCGFFIGDMFFSVPIERVQEVLKKASVTPLPGAPPSVAGLLNLRGAIVTVLDIRSRLGLPPAAPSGSGAYLLVREGNEIVALRIDRIGEVVTVDDGNFESPPDTLRGPGRELILGAHKLPHRLMLALNLDAAVGISYSPEERTAP